MFCRSRRWLCAAGDPGRHWGFLIQLSAITGLVGGLFLFLGLIDDRGNVSAIVEAVEGVVEAIEGVVKTIE